MGVYVFRFLLLVLGWSIPCIPIDIFLLFANKEKKMKDCAELHQYLALMAKVFVRLLKIQPNGVLICLLQLFHKSKIKKSFKYGILLFNWFIMNFLRKGEYVCFVLV